MRIKKTGKFWMLMASWLAAPSLCHAEIRTFDWGTVAGCASSWTSGGLRFSNSRGTICTSSNSTVTNGTVTSNDVAGWFVTHVNGKPFTPLSIDVGEYSTFTSDPAVQFVGFKAGGATVTASIVLDGLADGAGGLNDFQNFSFPPEFADIIRLEVANTAWSLDNFTFSTIVPPPFPEDQKLGPAFSGATLLYSKSILDDALVIGSDFQFVSGFRPSSPTGVKFLAPEGSAFLGGTYSPSYDRGDKALYFNQSNTSALRKYKAGVTTDAATLSDTVAAGYPMEVITSPGSAGGRLLFLGYVHSGNEPSSIFRKQNGVTTAIVTPATPLPIGKSTALPNSLGDPVVSATAHAFSATLASSPTKVRLYASFAGGPTQYLIGESDPIPTGETYVTVTDLADYEFAANGELRVRAQLSRGNAWLFYTSAGLSRIEYISATASPVNAGKQVTGDLFRTDVGVTFLDTHDEIFREQDGCYFRLIGVGDKIGGETISYLEFKAARGTLPLRVIVEARYASSSTSLARILELSVNAPEVLAPRFGTTFIHPESGDLFIPLSHLTQGREYRVRGSSNLLDWMDLWKIQDVVPMQHVVIPPELLVAPVFFRVEQR